MLVFLNGKFVPEQEAVVSVFDRSFLYGDGLFETMRVFNGKPFRWEQHLERLRRGAEFLKIKIPFVGIALGKFAAELISKNQMPDSLLRLTLSRGVGIRGYSPKGADNPSLVMSLHPAPRPAFGHSLPSDGRGTGGEGGLMRWKLVTSSFHLPANEPLAQFKTCNKLPQVLARAEADSAGADEALLLNTDGCVVEGASSNLFWMEGESVCTPPLASGILAGVTRFAVLELCEKLRVATHQKNIRPEKLRETGGVFVSLSSFGVIAGASLDGHPLNQSSFVGKLQNAYSDLLRAETR